MLLWEDFQDVRWAQVCHHKGGTDTIDGNIILFGKDWTAGSSDANDGVFGSTVLRVGLHGAKGEEHEYDS